MTLELQVQESITKRSLQKWKQIWGMSLTNKLLLRKEKGVTYDMCSERSTYERSHQKWLPKKEKANNEDNNSLHIRNSYKESYHQSILTPIPELNFDYSLWMLIPHIELKI